MQQYYPGIADREWQQDGLAKIIDGFLPSDETDFLVVACPGAGKTRLAIAAIKDAVHNNHVDLVVVVAPTETLRVQWVSDAKDHGVILERYNSKDLQEAMLDGKDESVYGIVTTYQQVAAIPDVFESFSNQNRTMLVADEIHHCAEHLSWGDALRIGFNPARKRLVLSGTPFRTDSGLMPFIMKSNGAGQLVVRDPDAFYNYGMACNDRVCRVVTFPLIDANIRFEDDDGTWEHLLSEEDLEPKFTNRMYRAALHPERCDFSRVLLQAAWDKLKEVRAKEQKDAAMLVIAKDNEHADLLQGILHAISGVKPVVVNSDRANSADKIRRFKKSKQPIIIAVKMFSEGVDAPRIRVIAFLTMIKTEMWFRQIVGRASRMQDTVPGDQLSYMFIPAIPLFKRMARAVEQEVDYFVDEKTTGSDELTWKCKECGHLNSKALDVCEQCGAEKPVGPPPPPPPTLVVHGSSNEGQDGLIAMGHLIEQAAVNMAADLVEGHPLLKRFIPENVAVIIKAMQTNPAWADRFKDADEVIYRTQETDDDRDS